MGETLPTNPEENVGVVPDVSGVQIDRDNLLAWYRQMRMIRRVEELAAKAYQQKKILGFCHLYIGQEAVAVGTTAALREDDYIVTAYRDHGQAMARGVSPTQVLAELFGREGGITKGIGGSMHMGSAEHNFFGGFGIVGGHIPLAVGAAFASKYRGDDRIALVYFGDGAAQQGAFYEALELAQLYQLPCIFLCENNYYAMGTSLERQSYLTDMSRRGDGVGMRRWQFGGLDVQEVYQHIRTAANHVRAGHGPILLEAVTYRYRGHSMSDPAKYRQEGELDSFKAQDCIDSCKEQLMEEHGMPEDDFKAIDKEIKALCQAAYEEAEASPAPNPECLYDFTYAPVEE
jgi:pyruvate dehydrogenase E1 component alpha subunit